jgi:hypothetical protein
MQTLTRIDRVDIEDYYHMTLVDKNVNWMKLTHLLLRLSLNIAQFCISTFTLDLLIAFLDIHIRDK